MPVGVVTPTERLTVGCDPAGVSASSADAREASRGDGTLAMDIFTPATDRAAGGEGTGVVVASADGDEVG